MDPTPAPERFPADAADGADAADAAERRPSVIDAMPAVREVPVGPPRADGQGSHGYVCLVDAMPRLTEVGSIGPEAAIVQSARVSYGKGTKSVQSDTDLLRYMFLHGHLTPFEMIDLKFCVKAPIFTARQFFRHRTGSFNEISARYSVIDQSFYLPSASDVRRQSTSNRQGSGAALLPAEADHFRASAASAYDACSAAYDAALQQGVSRELARIVQPVGTYTTFYWKLNLRNLFHFLKLRLDSAAQDDIREYAVAIFSIVKQYCPVAAQAFEDYELNAVKLSALEIEALRTGVVPQRMSQRERANWTAKAALLRAGPPPAGEAAAPPAGLQTA